MSETITQSYVLSKEEVEIIDTKAAAMKAAIGGSQNISNSAALRAIIREWAALSGEQPGSTSPSPTESQPE